MTIEAMYNKLNNINIFGKLGVTGKNIIDKVGNIIKNIIMNKQVNYIFVAIFIGIIIGLYYTPVMNYFNPPPEPFYIFWK